MEAAIAVLLVAIFATTVIWGLIMALRGGGE